MDLSGLSCFQRFSLSRQWFWTLTPLTFNPGANVKEVIANHTWAARFAEGAVKFITIWNWEYTFNNIEPSAVYRCPFHFCQAQVKVQVRFRSGSGKGKRNKLKDLDLSSTLFWLLHIAAPYSPVTLFSHLLHTSCSNFFQWFHYFSQSKPQNSKPTFGTLALRANVKMNF